MVHEAGREPGRSESPLLLIFGYIPAPSEACMLESIEAAWSAHSPNCDFASLRIVRSRGDQVTVRQGVVEPPEFEEDLGGMVTVVHNGGLGYAATADLSGSGIAAAVERARTWAERSAHNSVVDYSSVPFGHPVGSYRTPVQQEPSSVSLTDRIDLVREKAEGLKTDDRIVDWSASLWSTDVHSLYLTNGGGRVEQRLLHLAPGLTVVASDGKDTQQRTLGGRGHCVQGGLEQLEGSGFLTDSPRLARQVLELLAAPNCPSGNMDIVLAPDQMLLQIHESIGHPLELDRILGDERNYAGTSFVTQDMFGTYRYGSDLLDVTYDPTRPHQFASYGYDDDGTPAERQYIIKDGMLLRPLGGTVSQVRAGMEGVANARATRWNRPPIDRMANLNVEPGESSFDDLIGGVERGVYMESNVSWSIDDSRNKFQFGCEFGRVIEDGELKGIVKKPNYRGVSATFWRALTGVGDASTYKVLGTPFCGKGEPNQVIRVGHASPVCRFSGIDVFGGV
jgi:predicted Zn-dependent protease